MTRRLRVASEALRQQAPAGDRARSPAALLLLLAPVYALGAVTTAGALVALAASRPSAAALSGIFCLLAAATLAEAFPVQLESLPAGHVSLAAVFVVGTAVVYGWAAAALIALVTRAVLEVAQHRPFVRSAYNASTYAVGGAVAGLAAGAVPAGSGLATLAAASLAAAVGFYAVNVLLVGAVISAWASEPFVPLLARSIQWTSVPFGIMASVSLMLAVLWERSPILLAPLAGPLLAIVLHQRSVQRTLAAMRLALTDGLTGLGNNRHFQERLQAELAAADASSHPLTVCLIDVDDFKRINDTYGHAAGDAALVHVAGQMRRGGEGYRLGGDEFALLLPATDDALGAVVANAIAGRFAAVELVPGEYASVSIGVATYPEYVAERNDLLRLADDALYTAKREGKGRVRHYRAKPSQLHAVAS